MGEKRYANPFRKQCLKKSSKKRFRCGGKKNLWSRKVFLGGKEGNSRQHEKKEGRKKQNQVSRGGRNKAKKRKGKLLTPGKKGPPGRAEKKKKNLKLTNFFPWEKDFERESSIWKKEKKKIHECR